VGQKSYKANLVTAHFMHGKRGYLNPTQGIKIKGSVEYQLKIIFFNYMVTNRCYL
jgi:hypothetical protein